MKILCGLSFLGASVLLYFGSGMLLLVPGYPGENYFAAKRILYGVLPTMASVAILVLAAWLWSRSREAVNLGKSIVALFLSAIGAVVLFWIVVIIRASFSH